MIDRVVYLLGYTKEGSHTNWYPWYRFYRVFKHLGINVKWVEKEDIGNEDNRIFICWNTPDLATLVNDGIYKEGDTILQKLTSLSIYDKGKEGNWGKTWDECFEFFKNFRWSHHKILEDAYDADIDVWGWGARTTWEEFPEKSRIINKLEDRIVHVPWGSSLYSYDDVMNCKPQMDNLDFDIGYVGSIWGTAGRGNIDMVGQFLEPLNTPDYKWALAGMGTQRGPVNDDEHKQILRHSKVCPIVHALSWKVEKGIMDRFWSIFTTGRFGVSDNEGVLEFFNEDEVVWATDVDEWLDKTRYYIKNVDKQLPYIEKIQKRIREEYNWYKTWENFFNKVKRG